MVPFPMTLTRHCNDHYTENIRIKKICSLLINIAVRFHHSVMYHTWGGKMLIWRTRCRVWRNVGGCRRPIEHCVLTYLAMTTVALSQDCCALLQMLRFVIINVRHFTTICSQSWPGYSVISLIQPSASITLSRKRG